MADDPNSNVPKDGDEIMANQYKNKIIFGGQTLIDLTSDTIDAAHLGYGYTAHDRSGAPITGTNTFDSDTTDANATAGQILLNKTAYVNKNKVTGTMPNNGAVAGNISSVASTYTIPQGYHDGSGTVTIASTEQAKILAENIRQGITILGITGTMSGSEDVVAQSVVITPTTAAQTRTPGSGYNYISQVTVNAIPYSETDNSAGGVTVTIG